MKKLDKYIQEKLVIDKNVKTFSKENNYIIISSLCSLKNGVDDIYIEAIKKWVKENNVNNFYCYADHNVIDSKLYKYFENDKDKVVKYTTELIVDKQGEEIFNKKWDNTAIYVNDKVLIYHQYIDNKNIDRIFVKK